MPYGREYTLNDFVVGDKVMFKMPYVDDYGTWWLVTEMYENSLKLKTDFGSVPQDERYIDPKYVTSRERPNVSI